MLKTFIDRRIGGVERYYLAERESLVIVPDEVRKCVGFVYGRLPQGDAAFGTVFFVSFPIEATGLLWTYAVAAKHVIDAVRQKTTDKKVRLRLNREGGGLITLETDADDWVVHPTDSSVDVAVHKSCHLPPEVDYRSYPIRASSADQSKIQKHEIGTGDEVFITGLFVNHVGMDRNTPIVRIGNIAAMPGERVQTQLGPMEAYLIESRSIGGLSGSPVFVNLGLTRWIRGEFKQARPNLPYPTIFYLLGLVHGHFDVEPLAMPLSQQAINMGIAIVTPVGKILEVIDQEKEAAMRKKEEDELRKTQLPKMDKVDDQGVSAEEFENILRRVSRPKPDEPDRAKKGT